jgi:N-acetylglucosaminyldiphosphoundecaprenol N-acetyl-beta-D-mannosaminyltransferase
MKSLHIFALHLAYGGVEKAISEFSGIMAEKYEVTIHSVYKMPDSPAYPIDSRVKIQYLLDDIPNRKEFKAALAAKNFTSVMKEGLRSVRILHGKRAELIRAIRSINDGIIVTTRDEHSVLLSRYGRPGVKKVAQFHEDHDFRKALVRHFKYCYGNIDLLVLLSPKMVREVREMMKNTNHHTRVAYVPNFMKTTPPELPYSGREKTVLAVGRLDWVKGFDRLIDLFSKVHPDFPDWKLKIIGGGELYDSLKEKISSCDASSYISLTGKITPSQVITEMQRASVYVLSSYTESFPVVLLEAMSCSLPIVAFNTRGGLDMLVRNGENGFLAENQEGFLTSLSILLKEESLRRKMAEKSRELSSQYTAEAVEETWYQLIEDLYENRESL